MNSYVTGAYHPCVRIYTEVVYITSRPAAGQLRGGDASVISTLVTTAPIRRFAVREKA
jgi:hypothetical protein